MNVFKKSHILSECFVWGKEEVSAKLLVVWLSDLEKTFALYKGRPNLDKNSNGKALSEPQNCSFGCRLQLLKSALNILLDAKQCFVFR